MPYIIIPCLYIHIWRFFPYTHYAWHACLFYSCVSTAGGCYTFGHIYHAVIGLNWIRKGLSLMGTAHVFKQNSLCTLPLLRTAMSGAGGGAGAPGGGGGGGGAPHGGGGGGGGRTLARLGGGGGGGGGIDGVSDVCESDSDAERCGLLFTHVFPSAPDKSSVTESGDATCSLDGPRGEVPVSSLSSSLGSACHRDHGPIPGQEVASVQPRFLLRGLRVRERSLGQPLDARQLPVLLHFLLQASHLRPQVLQAYPVLPMEALNLLRMVLLQNINAGLSCGNYDQACWQMNMNHPQHGLSATVMR